MNRLLLIIFFFIFCIVSALGFSLIAQSVAGTAMLKGKVMDESGTPIPNATINIKFHQIRNINKKPLEKTVTSGKSGNWRMTNLESGWATITASAPGYLPEDKKYEVSQVYSNDTILFKLKRAPELVNKDQESAEIFEKGNAAFAEGKYDEALSHFNRFLEKNPMAFHIRFNMGNCYKEKGELDLALKEYETILTQVKQPEGEEKKDIDTAIHAKALAAIGEVYLKQEDMESAQKYFKESITINPNDEILAYNVGEIYFSNAKLAEALEYFTQASQIKPSWPDPYLKLGYVYLNQTEFVAAKENFSKFLKMAPEHSQAQSVEAILEYLEKQKKKS